VCSSCRRAADGRFSELIRVSSGRFRPGNCSNSLVWMVGQGKSQPVRRRRFMRGIFTGILFQPGLACCSHTSVPCGTRLHCLSRRTPKVRYAKSCLAGRCDAAYTCAGKKHAHCQTSNLLPPTFRASPTPPRGLPVSFSRVDARMCRSETPKPKTLSSHDTCVKRRRGVNSFRESRERKVLVFLGSSPCVPYRTIR